MDDLEQKVNSVLNNPESMAQLLSIAKSLGLGSQPGGAAPAAETGAPAAPFTDTAMQSVLAIVRDAEQSEGREDALLKALRPLLRPERREKIDKALKVARLTRLAKAAMKNLDLKNL